MAKNQSRNMVVVKFLQKSRPYNVGEVAGFPEDSEFLKEALNRRIVERYDASGAPGSAGPSAAKVK